MEHKQINTISYNGYYLLLCYLKDEENFSIDNHPDKKDDYLIRKKDRLDLICERYRDDTKINQNKFKETNTGTLKTFPDYLLKPLYYSTFGPVDDLVLILVDDFTGMFYLTADLQGMLNHMDLAFCPKTEFIGESDPGKYFCDLHTIYEEYNKEREQNIWEKQYPLIVQSSFKMNSFTLLTEGLFNQQTIYKAIVKKTNEIIKTLENSSSQFHGLLSPDDLKNLRCVLLDNQGSYEITILFFCSNYTLAIYLTAIFRTFTFENIFSADKECRELIEQSTIYNTIQKYYAIRVNQLKPHNIDNGDNDINGAEWFRDSHIFHSTYSILGITYYGFENPECIQCNGMIEIYTQLDINAGHQVNIERGISNIFENNPLTKGQDNNHCHRFLIGKHDFMFEYPGNVKSSLISLKDFLVVYEKLYKFFLNSTDNSLHENDLIDISSIIIIPLPEIKNEAGVDFICNQMNKNHLPLLKQIMGNIRENLFQLPENKEIEEIRESLRSNSSSLAALRFLDNKLKQLRMPLSLRKTIYSLFGVFQRAVGNPALFDSIIDIYDIFLILYNLLTIKLPEEQKNQNDDYDKKNLFTYTKYKKLAAFIEALQNAVSYRIYRPLPEKYFWDNIMDFKGIISQPIAAINVSEISGSELLKLIYTQKNKSILNNSDDTLAAAVTMVSFNPYPRSSRLNILENIVKNEEELNFLSKVEVNVSHLLDPVSYIDYFIKTIHMVFEYLVGKDEFGMDIRKLYFIDIKTDNIPGGIDTKRVLKSGPMQDRLRDIFTNKFIFDLMEYSQDDIKQSIILYIKYYLIRNSSQNIIIGNNNIETIQRYAELMIRLFLTKIVLDDSLDDAESILKENFITFCKDYKSYFSEHTYLTKYETEINVFFKSQYEEIYKRSISYIKEIKKWNFKNYFSDISITKDDVIKIENNFNEGKPFMCDRLFKSSIQKGNASYLLYFAGILKTVIKLEYTEMKDGMRHYINRNIDTGQIDLIKLTGSEKWNDFLVDSGLPTVYSVNPDKREKKLKWQIAALKTFWDLSNYYKRDVFNKLIEKMINPEKQSDP